MEITTEGRTPQEEITLLAWQGAKDRFGDCIPEKISAAIKHELTFIGEMNYASYFLTVYDIVRFARSRKFFARAVDLQPTQLFVIALVLPLLIPPNLICYLKGLFLQPVMSRLILMLTLSMSAGKK